VRVREKAPSATTAARPAIKSRARSLIGLVCLCGLGLAAFLGSGAPLAGAAGVEAPRVDHTFVSEVSESEATLHAEINPGEAATTYRFQYLTEQQFHEAGETFAGAAETPAQPLKDNAGNEAEDNEDHLATATISGLQPDTAYRYRVVATNTAGAGEGEVFRDGGVVIRANYRGFHTAAPPVVEPETCPNATIREEQHSTFLPDCRAYEQVSPVDKNGGDIIPSPGHLQAAVDGDAIKFASLVGFGDVVGSNTTVEYIARRGSGGWATHSITPSLDTGEFLGDAVLGGYASFYPGDFSADLSRAVFLSKSPLGETPENGGPNLYLRQNLLAPGGATSTLLSDSVGPHPYNASTYPRLDEASEDFSHVTFESKLNLTQDALDAEGGAGLPTSVPKLYETVLTGGGPPLTRLVGQVPPSGAECVGAACVPSVSQAGRGALAGNHESTHETISRDGSRAIFTAPPYSVNGSAGVLYLRDDQGTPSPADDATIQINASERSDCDDDPSCGGDGVPDPQPDPANPGGEAPPATFWTASADGSKIFFTTPEQLTDDDVNNAWDLYRFDVNAPAGGRLTRLSVDHELADNAGDPHHGSKVSGVVGSSADGSYVYFTVDAGQLVAGGPTASTGGPEPIERIFVWHDGAIHEVGGINRTTEQSRIDGMDPLLYPKWADVSPDGTHLAFVTQGSQELLSLYGRPEYDHGGGCHASIILWPQCEEVYLYDATARGGSGDLRCASCNPSGQSAGTNGSFWSDLWLDGGGTRSSTHLARFVSDDGRYLFFNSREALVPRDTNDALDAYVYDTHSEEVHLLSSGTSPSDSIFAEASPDGRDAFFTTREQLVGSDNDQNRDLYDARIGGGFPEPPPVPAPCTATDQCHGATASPPAPNPTAQVVGPADAAIKRCAKGRVRRHGRCLRKRHVRKYRGRHSANQGGGR
jgi:hypothetical protein